MLKFFFFFVLILFLSVTQPSQAQNISGVINKYTKVTAFDTCNVVVKVTDTAGFYKGLNVIVMQMNGAFITASNDSKFGNLESLANAGLYEFNTIDSVAAGALFLKRKALNDYDLSAAIQVISFPFYNDATVIDTLRAKPWDGSTGGVLAIDATTLTLLSDLTANGCGFRGGGLSSFPNCTGRSEYDHYYYPQTDNDVDNGGQKGEGIAQIISGRECGRGQQLNGGGGGNNHKSGGAGGGNFGRGGNGGELIDDGSTFFPCRGRFPGIGGNPISSVGADRIFLGGGGGAGHNREKSASNGANGGGIIIVRATNFNGNANKIKSNGNDAPFCSGDGAGGGGGGGTILMYTTKYNSAATIEAIGGKGGNAAKAGKYSFGPGGGGGGGRVLVTNTAGTKNIAGGNAGINTGNNGSNNAGKGDNGITNTATFAIPTSNRTFDRTLNIVKQPVATLVCTGKKTLLSVDARGNNLIYKWQLDKNDGKGYVNLTNDSTYSNVDSATMLLKNLKTDYNPYQYRCVLTNGCDNNVSITTNPVSLIIKSSPSPIFSTTTNYNTVVFSNGSSNATNYTWTFGDGISSNQANVTHIYGAQGTFIVVLIASNVCDTVSYTKNIVLNTPPKANFSSNTVDYCAPASVQFFNNSSNNATDYVWQFTGGTPSTSTDVNPTIVFNQAGVFDVTLTAKNASGADSMTKSAYVRVNSKPKAAFVYKNNGATFGFENKSLNGSTFTWDFGDGKTSTETNPQHAYANSGNFIVKMTVTNACGTDNFQDTVLLLTLPTAIVSANTTNGCAPLAVQYTAQNAGGTKSWDWSFPGGTPSTSNVSNPRVVYNAIGTYDVNLTVTNNSGANTTKLQSFIQVYDAPIASFSMTTVNSTVTFLNKSSNANIFMWDFGDGTTSSDINPPPHTYQHNGGYSVTLQTLNTYCGAATARDVTITYFVATTEADSMQSFSVYPNPNSGSFTITNKLGNSLGWQYKLISANGQVVLQDVLTNNASQEVDAQILPEGLYALCLSDGIKTWVKKIVLQR